MDSSWSRHQSSSSSVSRASRMFRLVLLVLLSSEHEQDILQLVSLNTTSVPATDLSEATFNSEYVYKNQVEMWADAFFPAIAIRTVYKGPLRFALLCYTVPHLFCLVLSLVIYISSRLLSYHVSCHVLCTSTCLCSLLSYFVSCHVLCQMYRSSCL